MSKPLVLFMSIHDWANTTYEAVRAINSVGRVEARHVVFWKHPWQYPYDVLVNVAQQNDRIATEQESWPEAAELMQRADTIHLWNCEFSDFYNKGVHGKVFEEPVKIPMEKVRSCTYAGTQYRNGHKIINQRLRSMGIKVCVEDPCFDWEADTATFIPHAVDTEGLKPLPFDERHKYSIGCYNPGRSYYDDDLKILEHAISGLQHNGIDATIAMKRLPIPNKEHMEQLARCWFFFQSMNTGLGTFGRSALEACALGIPAFSYISDRALAQDRIGGFHNPAIINVTPATLAQSMVDACQTDYATLSNRCRQWVHDYYGYHIIGEMYTKFFEEQVL